MGTYCSADNPDDCVDIQGEDLKPVRQAENVRKVLSVSQIATFAMVAGLIIAVGVIAGPLYDQQYDEGYDTGFTTGYEVGFDNSSYGNAYEDGYDDGYNDGFEEGFGNCSISLTIADDFYVEYKNGSESLWNDTTYNVVGMAPLMAMIDSLSYEIFAHDYGEGAWSNDSEFEEYYNGSDILNTIMLTYPMMLSSYSFNETLNLTGQTVEYVVGGSFDYFLFTILLDCENATGADIMEGFMPSGFTGMTTLFTSEDFHLSTETPMEITIHYLTYDVEDADLDTIHVSINGVEDDFGYSSMFGP